MMKRYILLILSIFTIYNTYAQNQCGITVIPSQYTFDCGDSIVMNLSGVSDTLLGEVFDISGPLSPGWSQTAGAIYTNPYIPSPAPPGSTDPDGGTYFWMGATSVLPAQLVTSGFDMTMGGQICYDMVYAGYGGSSPIEQPDQYDEGVSLQYSIDGGTTWIDIVYLAPIGDTLTSNPGVTTPNTSGVGAYEQWTYFCWDIPVGAQTSSTSIRWVQTANSGSCCDHWGLDNISLVTAAPGYGFFRQFGNDDFIFGNEDVVYPVGDSTFTYLFTNGIDDSCTASVNIQMNELSAGPDLVACVGSGRQITTTGIADWADVSWSPGATLDDSTSINPYAAPSVDTEYILETACGTDSVVVTVEATYDVVIDEPDTICLNGATPLVLFTTPTTVPINTVTWSNSGSLSDSVGNFVMASPEITTQYVATVVSDSGCIRYDSVEVIVQGVAAELVVVPNDTAICYGDMASLEAIPSGEPYTVVSTAFSPYPTTGGTQVTGFNGYNIQGPITLNFDFPFFGTNQNQIYFSSDGWFSFDVQSASSSFNYSIPTTTTPNNLIAWAWDDLDFSSGGTFSYYYGGTAPNRYIVFNFIGVPHAYGNETVSVQIVLYEDGTIAFYNIDVQSDGGTMTQGIENSTGTVGYPVPGSNNVAFDSQGEAWLFIPYSDPVSPVYTWSPDNTLSSSTGSTVDAFPSETTTYTVTMEDGFCTSYATATVEVDSIIIDSLIDDIGLTCPESNIELYVDAHSTVNVAAQDSILQVGYGTSSTGFGTPYEGFYEDGRLQLLFTAAELAAEGLNPGSNLSGMAFNVIAKGSSQAYQNYTISVQHTNITAVTGFVATGFTTVFGPSAVTTTLGWNWHDFATNFQWDGTSNLLFNICFDNTSWTSDDDIEYTQTTNNTVAYDYADGSSGCSLTGYSLSDDRANVRFKTDYQEAGFEPISYHWTSDPVYTFDDDTIYNPIIIDEVGDLTEVYVEVSSGACSVFDTVEIDFSGALTLTSDTTICEGDSVQLSAVGGVNPSWTPSTSLTDSTIADPIAFPTTTTIYEVFVELTNCSVSGEVEVTVSEATPISINNGAEQAATCTDVPVDLTSDADPAYTNTWFGPETGTGVDLTVNTSGVYVLSSENDFGCVAQDSINVYIADPGTYNTDDIRNVLCCDDAVTIVFDSLEVIGADVAEVYWDGATTPVNSVVTLYSDEDGTYEIRTVDVNGCENTVEFTIETVCNDADIDDIESIVSGETHDYVVFTSSSYDEEVWYPTSLFTNNTFSSNIEGENLVYINLFNNFVLNNGEEYSCVVADSSSVNVLLISNPEMPDAFTPDGDGLNDTFFPVNLDPYSTIVEFAIYNRWGEKVYSYDNDNGWDGTYNGEKQPVDTYTYYININQVNKSYINSGTVTLVK